ncbi:MAG: nicotinate-nucleotide adenylyltransferase [Actinomycetaceae bacterium]|nr:nicotinate-nucleotide adenylyltransferase [Actinomycetaceae bacterium]
MSEPEAGTPTADGPARKRRIGIMGGTFDPIHHGHLVAASEVQSVFNLDEVVFVPTGNQPYKQDRRVTLAEHRYLMAVVATASNPRFSVSRVDIERGGMTYTVDTLRDLRKSHPDANFFFITGADVLPQILGWKEASALWSMAHFVGVTRPGHQLDTSGLPPEGITLMEIPAMAISSTDCRNRVRSGVQPWYLVPDGVVQYIAKYQLYKPGEAVGSDKMVISDEVSAATVSSPGSGGDVTEGAALGSGKDEQ